MTHTELTEAELDALEQRAVVSWPSFCAVHQNEIMRLIALARRGIASEGKIENLELAIATYKWLGKWQPIETAPKDGTLVLLCSRLGTRQVAHWSGRAWSYGGGSWEDCATHWLPLPPAPDADDDWVMAPDVDEPHYPIAYARAALKEGE